MLSKAKIKFIKSLQVKKYREEAQCFLVEGSKSVSELLKSDFEILTVVGTQQFMLNAELDKVKEVIEVDEKELSGLGTFQSNDSVLAIAAMKPNVELKLLSGEYGLMLDDIRDPGNLGTIIRIADWYGITKIVASEQSTDFYNAKVITASMGSFSRVNIYYTSLIPYLLKTPGSELYGAFLTGEDIHHFNFNEGGFIVIGNEAHGISPDVAQLIHHKISIPRYGEAESLNAAVATAIVLDNLRRLQE